MIGASSDPCSELYGGPSAESDPEISQLTSYINNSIPEGTIKIYISLHSYGQYVLSPWGHTAEEFPDDYPKMMEVAKGFADALVRRYGTVFTYGSSATTLCRCHDITSSCKVLLNVHFRPMFQMRYPDRARNGRMRWRTSPFHIP